MLNTVSRFHRKTRRVIMNSQGSRGWVEGALRGAVSDGGSAMTQAMADTLLAGGIKHGALFFDAAGVTATPVFNAAMDRVVKLK